MISSLRRTLRRCHAELVSASILLLLTSCTTLNSLKQETYTTPEVLPVEQLVPSKIEWTDLPQKGFQITEHKIEQLNVTWHCVKIDLDQAQIQLSVYPTPQNPGKNYSVKKLAAQENAVLGINTTPFNKDGIPAGITKTDGKIISPVKENYCALAFCKTTSYRVQILETQTDEQIKNFDTVFGGFFQILKDGKPRSFEKNKRSRIGAGTNGDGRFLYIFAATPDFSFTDRNGLNYDECALIFATLGCTDAMQFDGGHSTAFVVNGKDVEKPFMQRKVPCVLLLK